MPRVLRGKPDKNPKLRIREYDDTGNFGGKTSRRINKYVDFGKEAEEDRRLDKLTARRLRREARNRPPRQATPVEPPAPAPAPATYSDDVFQAPVKKLSEEQMRDYGFGIPQWSPYYRFEGQSVQVGRAMSTDIGNFPKTQALTPAMQVQQARNNIAEMKGRAVVDHLWEPMGHRPDCIDDLRWIDVSREQATMELAHAAKMEKQMAEEKARKLAAEAEADAMA